MKKAFNLMCQASHHQREWKGPAELQRRLQREGEPSPLSWSSLLFPGLLEKVSSALMSLVAGSDEPSAKEAGKPMEG